MCIIVPGVTTVTVTMVTVTTLEPYVVGVLSRNICLGGKLRRGHSPRCQTSGGENFEFQIARDAI